MKQFLELTKTIIKEGTHKKDRTGTGTISTFGLQSTYNMSEGFPLLTIKKTPFKSIVTELLWFLKGDTNIQWLEQNGCSIWREWSYRKYEKEVFENKSFPKKWLKDNSIKMSAKAPGKYYAQYDINEFAEKIKTDDEFAKKFGDLGSIYGKQWVDWGGHSFMQEVGGSHWGGSFGGPTTHISGVMTEFYAKGINQIQIAIDKLKTFPEDRGIIVSAWNVSELNQMALRPCHSFFQFYTSELTEFERAEIYDKKYPIGTDQLKVSTDYDEANIPKYKLSLKLYQRSCDLGLGQAFNVASYSLLLHMISQVVNMIPNNFIHSFGDIHIYENHKEGFNILLNRLNKTEIVDYFKKENEHLLNAVSDKGPSLPVIKLNHDIKDIFDFKLEDIKIENYNPYPAIKMPVAV